MIKYLPKFSLPNRAMPVSFTAAQKGTVQYDQVYPTMSGGWTVFYPSSGAIQTRIAYIDPVNGHPTGLIYDYGNANVGSDPLNPASVASISGWLRPEYAMDAMYTAHGTSGSFWFLLKRNSVFSTGVRLMTNIHGGWPFRGLSSGYPVIVDAYGSTTGNRPEITSAEIPLSLVGSIGSRSNIAIKSVYFHNVRRDPLSPSYEFGNVGNLGEVAIYFYTNSYTDDIHVFDDIRVSHYRQAMTVDASDPIHNLFVNRSQFDKIYNLNGSDSTAIFSSATVNADFRECVIDKVGHFPYDPSGRAPGSNRNHAFYVAGLYNEQFKFRGNIINQPSFSAIQLRGGSGHLVSGNSIMRAGYAIPFGHDQNNYDDIYGNGITMNDFIRYHQADIINNFVSKPSNILGPTGTFGEAAGYGIGAGRINKVLVANNIIAHTGNSSGNCIAMKFSEMSYPWDNTTSINTISGNIVYNWIGGADVGANNLDLGVDKTTQGFPYKRLPESNVRFLKNYFIEPNANIDNTNTKGVSYQTAIAFGKGSFLSSGNTFYRAAPSGGYVRFSDTSSYNFGHWMNDLGDTSSVYSSGVLSDWGAPTRNDVSYISSLGLSIASGQESFIIRALNNRKGSWDDRFTSSALISYVRAGFAPIIGGGEGSGNLYGLTAFHVLNYDVFHAIRRRN